MADRQGGVFVVLGGSPTVFDDLERTKELLGREPFGIVACNLAGIAYPGEIQGWASLHSEMMATWRAQRRGNADYRAFIPSRHPNCPDGTIVIPRWDGSSGLYGGEVALSQFQAGGVILCGVPMDPEAGHFATPGFWSGGTHYRKAFTDALPTLGGRVRSMGGWSAQVYGHPTREWLAAATGLKSMGAPRSITKTRPPMYEVKNVSKSAQRFNVPSPDGGFDTVHLAPGESDSYDIDPNQAKFQPGGPLKATLIGATVAAPKPARAKPPAKAKVAKTAKPAAKPPTAPPVAPEPITEPEAPAASDDA